MIVNNIRTKNSSQSSNTQNTKSKQYLLPPQNPYSYRNSDNNSYPDSRQNTNTQNTLACSGELGNLMVMDPKIFEIEGILVTCGKSMSEKTIKFWDINTMKVFFEIPKRGFGIIVSMDYCQYSRLFATVTFDKKVSVYKFNPYKFEMNFKFSIQLNIPPSQIQIYKNYLFVSSAKKKQIVQINIKRRKIIRNFSFTLDITKFSFVPKLKSLATNEEGCSLIQLKDGQIQHIYYTLQDKRKSPYKMHRIQQQETEHSQLSSYNTINSCLDLPSMNSLDKVQQQKELVKLVNPSITKSGLGIENEIQTCKIAMYDKNLKCIIFVFFDNILFYDIINKKICWVIKDLLPIENVQYSYLHDLLIVQCTENTNSPQSFYLFFLRDETISSNENISFNKSQIKFNRLSCEPFLRSKNLLVIDQYLILDFIAQDMKGKVSKARIFIQNKLGMLPSAKVSSVNPSLRVINRNASNQKFIQYQQVQQKDEKLEAVEEENPLNSTQFVEKKEKLCWCCTIF